MALYAWRNSSFGAGGAFDVASNWSNANEAISTSVPSAGDTATFAVGGGGISGTGSVDTIQFAATAWSIIGQLTASTVTLDNGSLTAAASGGQLVVNGVLQVGLAAYAGLSIVNGGAVNVTGSASGPVSSFGSASLYVANRGLASFGGGVNLGANGLQTSVLVTAAVMAVGGVLKLGAGGAGPGGASMTINGGGQVVLSSPTDTSTPYLQVAAVGGSSGSVTVDGANSLLLLANNSGSVGYAGTGTLAVTNGGAARFNASANTSNNALNPALTIGRFGVGTVTVSGTGSLVAAGGSIIVGSSGHGTLQVLGKANVTSLGFVAAQAALAVGTSAGGSGSVTIDGSGTSLIATGATILGGDNRGSGLTGGGTGTISITGGGLFQTGATTILYGSSIALDGASQAVMSGDVNAIGSIYSSGTLVVGGALYGGGAVQVGGLADIGQLGAVGVGPVTMAFISSSATIRLHNVTGANTINGFQVGDGIDMVSDPSVRLTGTVLTTATGTVALSAEPAGSHYELSSDGAGGTFVALTADTIGVYRFFDSNYGTHFFSASVSEKDTIMATRSDLVYEGVGLQSIDPASSDPNASPVYRFFDETYGTHFFTASASERDTVIATRSDLAYEGTGFIEHTAQQSGDTPVYRFFDTKYGTHFYTADANERATVIATRPDLVDEGVGFYAPTN